MKKNHDCPKCKEPLGKQLMLEEISNNTGKSVFVCPFCKVELISNKFKFPAWYLLIVIAAMTINLFLPNTAIGLQLFSFVPLVLGGFYLLFFVKPVKQRWSIANDKNH